MRLLATSEDHAIVELDAADIARLCSCINETLEAIEEWEFDTRVGMNRQQAKALQEQLKQIALLIPEK